MKKQVKKKAKKRASKYEEKLKTNLSFDQIIKKAVNTPPKKRGAK